MLIAHLPAGYLLAHADLKRRGRLRPLDINVAPPIMVGSMFPDLDMLAFLFWDNGQIHHHDYWLHIPSFWLLVFVATWAMAHLLWRNSPRSLAVRAWGQAFILGIFLHLVLDSFAAPIRWFAPLSNLQLELIHVPATQSHWILSMVLHWSFLAEIIICGSALALFLSNRRRHKASN